MESIKRHPEGELDNFIYLGDMYSSKLNTSTFTGTKDLEQFVEEFHEVWEVAQWPPRVALIKLREALTGRARPFGQGRSVTEIFTALRSRFGTPALEARARLRVLRRKADTPLRNHATLVQRLARSAYSDLPETHRRSYTLTDFMQSLNDVGLYHQLQAKRVTTLEGALQVGEDYLRAERLYTETTQGTQVTTEAVQSLTDEVNRLSTLLEQVVKTLTSTKPPNLGPQGETSETATLCGKDNETGHLRSSCLQFKRPPHFQPREPPRPREPRKEQPRGGYRWASKRTPRDNPREWQVPRRTSRLTGRREPFILPITNRFSQLPETEPASEVQLDIGGELNTPPPKKRHGPMTKRKLRRLPETTHAGGVRLQPHGESYFLPGKVAGKAVTFLLDSACNTNLLSKRVFDALPPKAKGELAPYSGEPGTLADGSRIPFYGVVELPGRVRDQAIQETFILSHLEEDAILGTPFLRRHKCHMDFHKSAVLMAGKELSCVDKFGRPLVGGVQVVRNCTVPDRSWATIYCRVNDRQLSGLGFVEGTHTRIQLASSLNWLTDRGEILVQCVNPFSESVTLPSRSYWAISILSRKRI